MARPQQLTPRISLQEFMRNIELSEEAIGDGVSAIVNALENQGFMAALGVVARDFGSHWNAMDTVDPVSLNPRIFPLRQNCLAAQKWIDDLARAQSNEEKMVLINKGLETQPIREILTVFRFNDRFHDFSQMPIFNQNAFQQICGGFSNVFNRALNEVEGLEGFREEYNTIFGIGAAPALATSEVVQGRAGREAVAGASASAAQPSRDRDEAAARSPSPETTRRGSEDLSTKLDANAKNELEDKKTR